MDTSVGQFAIQVNDLVVGFGRRVVINHLALDVRRWRDPRLGRRVGRR